jgi:hypothetical protein
MISDMFASGVEATIAPFGSSVTMLVYAVFAPILE